MQAAVCGAGNRCRRGVKVADADGPTRADRLRPAGTGAWPSLLPLHPHAHCYKDVQKSKPARTSFLCPRTFMCVDWSLCCLTASLAEWLPMLALHAEVSDSINILVHFFLLISSTIHTKSRGVFVMDIFFRGMTSA